MLCDIIIEHLENSPTKTLKKGETLYSEGDEPNFIYIIQHGIIGLFHISETGKETFLRVFGKDSVLGHRSFFANEPYHANSTALSTVQLKFIHKDKFKELYTKDPSILLKMTERLSKDLKSAELRLSNLQDKSAYVRVAESLVFLKLKHPEQVWTRQQIAEHSFTTNETVTRTMTKLEEMNLIEKLGRDFKIFNPDELLTLTNEDFQV